MARRVFFGFHYAADCERAAQVRNMGVVEGNRPATDNDWEQIKRGGDAAIKRWIQDQLQGKSCCVVLIGRQTAGRKWISYEISEAWNQGMGVLGVCIHNLRDLDGAQTLKGSNPFRNVSFTNTATTLASFAKVYDPPFSDSKQVYGCIRSNLESWIEAALAIRDAP
jgi:hypothetical protein